MISSSYILQTVKLDAEIEAAVVETARQLGLPCLRRPSFEVALKTEPGTIECVVAPLPSADAVGYVLETAARLESTAALMFITRQLNIPCVVEAMRVGADDVLGWPVSSETLEATVRRALSIAGLREKRADERRGARQLLARLSNGEIEVLDLMLEGRVNKVVASRLNIAVRTVENRRKQIFTKLGTRSLADIVRLVQLVGADAAGGLLHRNSPVPAPLGLLTPRVAPPNRIAV